MRYIELFENEQRIDTLLSNPKFTSWFNGSKVVDSNGRPEIVFHYSTSEVPFKRFRSFSHFGTNKAAEERFDYFYDEDDEETHVGFTVPCFLNIKKPLFIEDFQSSSNMLAYDLYINDKISFNDLYNVSIGNFKKLLKDYNKQNETIDCYELVKWLEFEGANADFSDDKLVSLLNNKGYDGMCYINEVEDSGSISWITFKSDQIWNFFSNKND